MKAWEVIERHRKDKDSSRRSYGSRSKKHDMDELVEKMEKLLCEAYDCGYEEGVEESDER